MNDDQIIGTAEKLGGTVEEGFGRATGDLKSQLQGKARQMEGALQDLYGEAKESMGTAAETVRETVSGADDFVRGAIEQRPYTSAAVALGIGFLIGHFARRDSSY